jgi:hypothetical protein
MFAGQAISDHFSQHPADHGAQGFLYDFVIWNQAIGCIITHLH